MAAHWRSRAYSIINREFDLAIRGGDEALYKTRDRLAHDLESAYQQGKTDGWWLSWTVIFGLLGTLALVGFFLYKKSFLFIWPR